MKPVKSTDPHKAEIVAAFKSLFDCRKVTCVREQDPTHFVADCMIFNAGAIPFNGSVQVMVLRDRRIARILTNGQFKWIIDYSNPGANNEQA